MADRPLTGLYDPQPREDVIADLRGRLRRRLTALPEPALVALLEDAVYQERRRLERADPASRAPVERLARALVHRPGGDDRVSAALDLVGAWADEIHGRFSMPAYRFATSVFPPALQALLSSQTGGAAAGERITIDGPIDLLRELAGEATLLLTPTHVSNLDSPLIGLALATAGLPPFQYGAGLNLFSNPLVGWWMRRLGAYTVDRTKKAALYKLVLKDYSIRQLRTRHHGLFFPGGTRSRSGLIETRVKKGLLGTGLAAWQENLAAGRADPDVYVVPMTLSFQLTLEASTLIDDHLAEIGKQRYIISDDEFAQPRRVAQFVHRVLSLDAACVVRFGQPLDVLGNPVPADRAGRAEASRRRRAYVCDRAGQVEWDEQRDHLYTERLAHQLTQAWPGLATVMTSHLAAWAAWRTLERRLDTRDPFRLVRASAEERRLPAADLLEAL
ncbi:MAG TPA: 1-acyl-sn-glycerol-3-phosphate acyltransferase, partial [Myxococcota bacterium]|nr:1-acyl-sn-glycerol-3-phosphate acyltransferase [Myxococcota bacterium]